MCAYALPACCRSALPASALGLGSELPSSAPIRRWLQRRCDSQTKQQQRPWCGHTATGRLHTGAVLSSRGRDAATSIRQRIHARPPPVGFSCTPPPCRTVAHCTPPPLRSFALHLRQAREAELVARLKDAEDALAANQRREREHTEQAPADFAAAQFPPHVFAFGRRCDRRVLFMIRAPPAGRRAATAARREAGACASDWKDEPDVGTGQGECDALQAQCGASHERTTEARRVALSHSTLQRTVPTAARRAAGACAPITAAAA